MNTKEHKNTKKTLKSSGLALLVCVVMLLGTTFAWFTDSITNNGNKIQSGTLDIGAKVYAVGEGGMSTTIFGINGGNAITFEKEGTDLEGSKNPIINETLWEPGKTSAKLLQVTNNGTLATKIKVDFNVTDSGLLNSLWFDFVKVSDAGQVEGTFQKRPMSQLETIGDNVELALLDAGANVKFVLVYGMDETVGNEAQNKTFKADVSIVAKQAVKEEDGFGNNTYDENAVYPVGLNSSFEEVMENAKLGDTINVASGSYKMPKMVPEGVSIVGEGKEKTEFIPQPTENGNNITGIVIDKPGVKISNAYVRSVYGITADEYHGSIDIRESVILDSLKFEKPKNNYSTIVIKNGVGVDDTVTISNSEIQGKFKTISIVDGVNGTVNIFNCDITGVYTINVNSASSQNLILNIENSKLHGWTSYGDIKSATFTNTEFSKGKSAYDFIRPYADTTWNNCTFDAELTIGAGAVGKTYTFNGCTKNGTLITAENIKNLNVLDMSASDGENLKNCKIIVDGTTVSLQ